MLRLIDQFFGELHHPAISADNLLPFNPGLHLRPTPDFFLPCPLLHLVSTLDVLAIMQGDAEVAGRFIDLDLVAELLLPLPDVWGGFSLLSL